MYISSFDAYMKFMMEEKDDNWTDWLIDNKYRWKPFREPRWKTWAFLAVIVALSIAIFYTLIFVCFQGYIFYAHTILPFRHSVYWYIVCFVIIAGIISSCIITAKKKYRKERHKVGLFVYLTMAGSLAIAFGVGIIFFLFFFSNSYFGNNAPEKQVAIIKKKSLRYHKVCAGTWYVLYLPHTKSSLLYRARSFYHGTVGSSYLLYMHKGYFGLHVADSLTDMHVE